MIRRLNTLEGGKQSRLVLELEQLRARLEEAEATLNAIRSGEVDALVVSCDGGDRIFTLEGAETAYRTLIEAMTEGALTVGPSGTILYSNRCFAEMIGEPLERVVGANLTGFEHVDGGEASIAAILAEARRSGAHKRELRLMRAAGPLHVQVSASLLPDRGEERLCVVVTDLTSQKRSEELERAETEARHHRDLAEKRALELARSNADLENFAYLVSHDLKEPLRGISNYASFLLDDYRARLDPAGESMLQSLVRLSKRMHSLLDAILEYGRVGRGSHEMSLVPVETVAREVLESLSSFIAERRAVVEIQGELPSWTCDRTRVGQVISNLVVNGIKFNRSESPRITIGAAATPDGPAVFVRDNGIGIDARYHHKVFDIFRRLHQREEFGGGTGVGLTIVQKIVQQHGGRVWFESTPGEGTTFYFNCDSSAR